MIIDGRFASARGGNVNEIVLAPLEAAPVQSVESFGPCLLAPGPDSEWVIGHWDGHGWYSEDGAAVSPVVWALLPPISDVISRAMPTNLAGAIAILEQISSDEDQTYPEAIRNVLAFLRGLAPEEAPLALDRGARRPAVSAPHPV